MDKTNEQRRLLRRAAAAIGERPPRQEMSPAEIERSRRLLERMKRRSSSCAAGTVKSH